MLANILAVGLMASVMSFSPRYVVDNQNDTLTFSAEELNNNTYQNLAEQLSSLDASDLPNEFSNATITYNGNTYNFDELAIDQLLYVNQDKLIYFTLDTEDTNYSKWSYNNGEDNASFTASMTINNAEWFIDNIEEPPSLTLSKYDLNNKKYTYLAEQLNKNQDVTPQEITHSSINYNGNTYHFDEFAANDNLTYLYTDTNNEDFTIMLVISDYDTNYGKWVYNTPEIDEPFTASMTINNAEWFLENMYAPLDSGDMMTAITSGLPLMASLAQAFLNGFTSIFWNSTTSSLTTFSMFALIMLSVAIVFACIKLVLNVVRSNTGV